MVVAAAAVERKKKKKKKRRRRRKKKRLSESDAPSRRHNNTKTIEPSRALGSARAKRRPKSPIPLPPVRVSRAVLETSMHIRNREHVNWRGHGSRGGQSVEYDG